MEKLKIQVKKVREWAIIPSIQSSMAAGCDLHMCCENNGDEVEILPGEAKMLGTGITAAIPEGYFGGIFARSGLASKEGLRPANCVGVVDADYRGEIKVCMRNDSSITRTVKNGERIAQLVILPCPPVVFEEVDELSKTERGAGGFGHTGK